MTENRSSKKLLISVACFYVIVSVLAVCTLNLSASVFSKRGAGGTLPDHISELFTHKNKDTLKKNTQEPDSSGKIEGLEGLSRDEAEESGEEPGLEEEEVREPEPEPEPEPVVYEEPQEERFYSFRTNNTETGLRMRENPGEDSRIVYELKPGSTGYVIEIGDEWSRVSAYSHEGYCSNEFLSLTEVTKEEYEQIKAESDTAQDPAAVPEIALPVVFPAVSADAVSDETQPDNTDQNQ